MSLTVFDEQLPLFVAYFCIASGGAHASPEAHTGNIPFPSFASWADAGGMSEEELNHAEVLGTSDWRFDFTLLSRSFSHNFFSQSARGNIAQRCFDSLHEEKCLVEAWLARTDRRDVSEGGFLGIRCWAPSTA